jgi:hypothetical protein
LSQSLQDIFEKKVKNIPSNQYTLDIFKSLVKTSSTFSNLEKEIGNLLSFYAWNKQILYFRQIQACFNINKSEMLASTAESILVEPVPDDMMFFVEDAIDQIIADLKTLFEDEAYESGADDSGDSDTETSQISTLIDSSKHKSWKDAFKAVFNELARKKIESAFVKNTISVILNYIASMRNANMGPSEAQFEFVQEDKQLKQALLDYAHSNKSKRKTQFLIGELHKLTSELIELPSSDNRMKLELIKHSIKYGYPLPMSAAKPVADAFDRFLKKSKIYSAGLTLIISDDTEQNVALSYKIGDGKAKMHMRHFNGSVFICQADYRASIGMSDQMNEEVDNAFFYEAFIARMKMYKSNFPKQAETLRAGLLEQF